MAGKELIFNCSKGEELKSLYFASARWLLPAEPIFWLLIVRTVIVFEVEQ